MGRETAKWIDYYNKVSKRAPHRILKVALSEFQESGVAYDLGAGAGVDTDYLLNLGWKVNAVDSEKESISYIKKRVGNNSCLKIQCKKFEELKLKKSDLIFSAASLPFCHPDHFDELWEKIYDSLKPGGILTGNLFGDKDDWFKKFKLPRFDMTFKSHKQFLKLIENYEVLYFDEEEEDRPTALGTLKHWHIYDFVLKKKSKSI